MLLLSRYVNGNRFPIDPTATTGGRYEERARDREAQLSQFRLEFQRGEEKEIKVLVTTDAEQLPILTQHPSNVYILYPSGIMDHYLIFFVVSHRCFKTNNQKASKLLEIWRDKLSRRFFILNISASDFHDFVCKTSMDKVTAQAINSFQFSVVLWCRHINPLMRKILIKGPKHIEAPCFHVRRTLDNNFTFFFSFKLNLLKYNIILITDEVNRE